MSSLNAKIGSVVILTSSTVVFGLLSLKVDQLLKNWFHASGSNSSRHKADMVMSFLLCFGGGVLFATCFLHMIPDIRESVDSGPLGEIKIPMTELLISCGFFLVYLIEEVIHTLLCIHSGHAHHAKEIRTIKTCIAQGDEPIEAIGLESSGHCHQDGIAVQPVPCEAKRILKERRSDYGSFRVGESSIEKSDHPDHQNFIDSYSVLQPLRSMFIVMALSFHSIFEGLAIGLQERDRDVWYLLIAISLHKVVLAFCVGMELAASGVGKLMTFMYIAVFSLVSPVGIVIGIVVTSASSGTALDSSAITVLQGIAAGTLLYVTFFEVLQREREKPGNGLVRVMFVVVGYCIMVILEAFGGQDHPHAGNMNVTSVLIGNDSAEIGNQPLP